MAAEPAAAEVVSVRFAVFDLVLGVEMGAGGVVGSDRLNEAEPALLVEGREGLHHRMQGVEIIEPDRGSGFLDAVRRRRDAKGGAVGVVIAIAVRHEHVQRIGAAAKEDADQRVSAGVRHHGELGEDQPPQKISPGENGEG